MFILTSASAAARSAIPSRGGRRAAEAVAVGFACLLAPAVLPVERVTWENLDRIRVGMAEADVRSLLCSRPDERFVAHPKGLGLVPPGQAGSTTRRGEDALNLVEVWETNGLSIAVFFDHRGRVASRYPGVGHARKGWNHPLWRSARSWLARIF